ncbi:MAG TPA: hypothetical protein PLP14_09210, partial [Chitinophagaceae bacterium]|nr:hypothetical protein [Chitinophagaceae bacterium]
MKNTFYTLALLSVMSLLLGGCSKINSINLTKTYSDIEFTIPAPQAAGLVVTEAEVNADLAQLAQDYGFDINKIESAKIKSISLQIMDTTSTPYTFSVIDQVDANFYADGISVIQVGTDDAIHTSPSQIDFDLNGVDVTPYLKASLFKVKLNLT